MRPLNLSRPSLILSLLVGLQTISVATPAQDSSREAKAARDGAPPYLTYFQGTAPVTLSNGSGDRSLSVTVDGYGSFGSSTPADDAVYDPIGPAGPAGTVYESGVYFSRLRDFLTTDSFGAGLPPVAFSSVTSTSAQSTFTVQSFRVTLTQTVSRNASGSVLVQTYDIRNETSSSASFELVRHLDGDLGFDGSLTDFGAASPDGRVLSEFDAGDDPSSASTFVGITAEGGTPSGFAIQPYPFTTEIQLATGIPEGVLNSVALDADGDRVTDSGYDVTLSLANAFTLAPGETAVYVTTTRFGDQTLAPRATLQWDPPDDTSPLEEPPPQRLQAFPVGSASAGDATGVVRDVEPAWPTARRAEVAGYNVYSSASSPVVPSPSTFFTSVPPNQTTVAVPTSAGGSFFVVTATYPTGESGPSNEASADVPAATLTNIKVTAAKVVGKGSEFTATVQVFLDGIPFVNPAKVKGTNKVVQKGLLVTGQTVGQYVASKGGVALVQFRNSNGGIAARRFPN